MKKAGIFILIVALCVLLAACGEQKAYDEACTLFESGHYAEAIEMFRALGRFGDSPDRVRIAQTRLDQHNVRHDVGNVEAARALKYADAFTFLKEGRTREAYEAFSSLGNYRDSADMLRQFTVVRGALVSEEVHYVTDDGDTLRGCAEYTYGADGLAVSRSGYCKLDKYGWFEDFNFHYGYDDAGNVARVDAVNASGTLSFSIEYEYSDNGRVVRELYSDSFGTKHEFVYDYSFSGSTPYTDVVESEIYNGKPFPQTTWQYGYCEFGVSSIKCDEYSTAYEYDADGRCTGSVQSYPDGSRYVTEYRYEDVYIYAPAE